MLNFCCSGHNFLVVRLNILFNARWGKWPGGAVEFGFLVELKSILVVSGMHSGVTLLFCTHCKFSGRGRSGVVDLGFWGCEEEWGRFMGVDLGINCGQMAIWETWHSSEGDLGWGLRLGQSEVTEQIQLFKNVYGPFVVTLLNWTCIFEWYMCKSDKKTHSHLFCLKSYQQKTCESSQKMCENIIFLYKLTQV